jgi:signal transduction histidine kinase
VGPISGFVPEAPACSGCDPDPVTSPPTPTPTPGPAPEPTPAPRPPLVRSGPRRLVAGVAEGVAAHLDAPVVVVRLAFTVLGGSGLGILAYIALWVLLPTDPDAVADPGDERTLRRRARRVARLAAYLIVGGIVGALLGAVGRPFGGTVLGPLALAGVGALLIWRRAPDDQRSQWSGDARSAKARFARLAGRWSSVGLALAGTALVVVGVAAFLAAHDALAQARAGALSILAVLVGVVLVAGPWLLRLWRDLAQERRQRIRAEERSAVAAHVHDSVLQTLALLQARAGDPAAVRRLARRQERDLRSWLYGADDTGSDPAGFGPTRPGGAATLGSELRRLCAEIEDDTEINVEVVVVGDTTVDDRTRGLLAATREAVLNAAKSSGAPEVALYAEADGGQVAVWIRDRGRGFDPDAVGADRHGIRDSIHGRMHQLGGSSRIRSAVGSGCEVELVLPRPVTPLPRSNAAPATDRERS